MIIQTHIVDQKSIKEFVFLMKSERYFEAHEVLERVWVKISKNDPKRDFYKGLIQSAAAFHLIKKNSLNGGFRLLKSSLRYLEAYEFDSLGLNLDTLRRELSYKAIRSDGV